MKLKLFTSTLLGIAALMTFGCTDDSDDDGKLTTCSQDCSAMTGGPFERYCGRLNGEYRCLEKCEAQAEGQSQSCHEAFSAIGEDKPFSTVQKCAKDDDGKFYVNGYSKQPCSFGCGDETAGLCNSGMPLVENNCEVKNSPIEYVVATINGEKSCWVKCHGENEGENAHFCYEYDSIHYSGMTTCAKDDNGLLYGTLDNEDCEGACVAETGLCEAVSNPE